MPRPGPRPYECVRRAWHSDRHQSIRGSIIQQIFRVAYQTHSSSTKKNREWQSKLPSVVFKAEEIIYSKANSEAEYMNSETLWDRLNDAIDTIIRRDETTETGDLLPPCVEAALNLGCVAERASRSQRHSNPRVYLTPRAQGPSPGACRSSDNKSANDRHPQLPPTLPSDTQQKLMRSEAVSSGLLASDSICDNLASPCSYPPLSESSPLGSNQLVNLGSIYPLYYGTKFKVEESMSRFQSTDQPQSDAVLVGTPVTTFTMEPADVHILQDPFATHKNAENISTVIAAGPDFRRSELKFNEKVCDLSLRLGIISEPSTIMERNSTQETRDVRLGCSQEGLQMNREFSFFPQETAAYSPESCSRKWFSEDGDRDHLATVGKRRVSFGNSQENVQDVEQPDLPLNWYNNNRVKGSRP